MPYILIDNETDKYVRVGPEGYPDLTADPFQATRYNFVRDALRYTAVMSWKDYDNPLYRVAHIKTITTAMPECDLTGADLARFREV